MSSITKATTKVVRSIEWLKLVEFNENNNYVSVAAVYSECFTMLCFGRHRLREALANQIKVAAENVFRSH